MCNQECVDFDYCNHTYWGKVSSCSKYKKERERRPFFQKIIGWQPKHCPPRLTRKKDPNMCPRCQNRMLKKQFTGALNGDPETRDRAQKQNITWRLDSAQGTTGFRRDEAPRHCQGYGQSRAPKKDTESKSRRTRARTAGPLGSAVDGSRADPRRQGQGSRGQPQENPAMVPHQSGPIEQNYRARGPVVPSSPGYRPGSPFTPMGARGVATNFSKPLPPLPLNVQRKPALAKEPLAHQVEYRPSSPTLGKNPFPPSGRSEYSNRPRHDNDRRDKDSPPQTLRLATRGHPTSGAAYAARGKKPPSSRQGGDGRGQGRGRGDPGREFSPSYVPARLRKRRRSPGGSRFVEHFSSDEDMRPGRPATGPTGAAAFDDERLARMGRRGSDGDKGKQSRVGRSILGARSKEGGGKSPRAWLRDLRPPSPAETELSFACRRALEVERRRG